MAATPPTRPPQPSGGQTEQPSSAHTGARPAPAWPPALIGRHRELDLLHTLLDQALAGVGGIVMLAGEAGVGKTRLAEELATTARARGAIIRWGRCYEGEGAPAYWPWVQVLRACVLDTEPDILRADLAGGAAVIAQIVPELGDRLPNLPPTPQLEPDRARFRLFDAIATFLHNTAAHHPLLLILDDLHWADTPSLLLLRFLAKDVHHAPLLLVGAYRDIDLQRGHPLAQTMGELARVQACQRLTLGGLAEQEVARFIEEVTGRPVSERLARAVYHQTEGNPFFVTAMVRLPATEGQLDTASNVPPLDTGRYVPQTVREVLERRLDRLSEGCRRTLHVAAVLGLEFTLPALEQVAAASGMALDVLEALEEAEEARIITVAPGAVGRYRFSSALLRETLYAGLTATRRARLHRHAGEVLESLWQGATDTHLGELAHHFVQAVPGGDVERAVSYARRAAERAAALTGYEEAARFYELALRALTLYKPAASSLRCDLTLGLAEAHWKAGDGATARATFREAAALARALSAPEHLGQAALGFARPDSPIPNLGVLDTEAVSLLREALSTLPSEASRVRARLLARLAQALPPAGDPGEREALSRTAVEMARRLGDPATAAYTLKARHHALLGTPNVWRRFAAATAIVRLARESGDSELLLHGHAALVLDLLELGDGPALDEAISTCARLYQELQLPVHASLVASFRAMRLLTRGRFVEAERMAQYAVLAGQPVERQAAIQSFAIFTFFLRREQGRLGEVEAGVREFVERYPTLPGWRAALALLYAETGRLEEARAEFELLAADGFDSLPRDAFWLTVAAVLAIVCGALGDVQRAERLYTLLLPYDGHVIVTGYGTACAGAVAHYLGVLAATLGRTDAGSRHLAAAIAAHTRLDALPLLAHSRLAAAQQHAHAGEADAARALAVQALETAAALDMARLEAQAQSLLARLDSAPTELSRARPAYPDGLTAREVEVLRLLAGGMTTREIAEQLVLSMHTVTRHIANIYAKINARGRADAATYAHVHNLVQHPAC